MSRKGSSTSYEPIMPRRRVLPNVLNFMDGSRVPSHSYSSRNKSATDIFDLLRRAVNERRRVEVLTRDCRGIDGILIGWLLVFDKHMNLIMSDVDEVLRRLTDGHDYLQLGPKQENLPAPRPAAKRAEVPNDFQTFRAQLANFLQNKKKQPTTAKPPRPRPTFDDGDDEHDDHQDENQPPAVCHPEHFLSMELLSINNLNVQRLSGRTKHGELSPASSAQPAVALTSKRAKVRFFSRHIPKLFVKGNQVCLIRLLPSWSRCAVKHHPLERGEETTLALALSCSKELFDMPDSIIFFKIRTSLGSLLVFLHC